MGRSVFPSFVILVVALTASCGGGGNVQTPPQPLPAVTISPLVPSVRAGTTMAFTATVNGVSSPTLTWSVNAVPHGNSTFGTITSTGTFTATYTAPATLPSSDAVAIEAAISTDAAMNGSTTVTLLNPTPQVSLVAPSFIPVGPFTITVLGSGFASGAVVNLASMQLATTFVSGSQLSASGTATSAQVGTAPVTVTNPDPGSSNSNIYNAQVATAPAVTAEVADRFLEQATFGPTTGLIAQVQQTGLPDFLTTQLNLPVTTYPDPAPGEKGLGALQQRFFTLILYAPDQLRQRVAFALGQIFVIAGDKINTPQAFTPYLDLLDNDAFANYRQIMKDVTLSPAMGHYLDMVNNDKPNSTGTTHANENYARELMQLFSIGTSLLNDDGSPVLDSSGNPIPTYTQNMVQAFARAFTGWTYPTQPGMTTATHNPEYWNGPMVAVDSNHDTNSKQLLQYSGASAGGLLPAGQTAEEDLDGAIDNIFNHPNVPPFVAIRLIQHLVTSNPSPAYIQRISDVFRDNGSGVRGDMKAVITAILLDPEARRGDDPSQVAADDGHLQEPVLYMAGLLRAFGATTDGSNLAGQGGTMGQTALFPPSVFNFYSPGFVIPGSRLLGPEFQTLTTATTASRANWVSSLVFGSLGSGTKVDFSGYGALAANPGALLDSLNALMLHGTMSAGMRSSILSAMQAVPAGSTQTLQQAKTAIYLIGTSSSYQVQH